MLIAILFEFKDFYKCTFLLSLFLQLEKYYFYMFNVKEETLGVNKALY